MQPPGATRDRSGPSIGTGIAAPIGFLAAYLAVSPVSGALADRPLPLPGSPAAETAAFYAANPLAVAATAALQVFSVICFAIFVSGLARPLRAAGAGWLTVIGYLSAAAIIVSSTLSGVLAAIASSAGDTTIEALRQASFLAGGVANVATLGLFVVGSALVLSQAGLLGQPTRWFGLASGGIAMLSVLSLVIYYASVALPAGRVLSMVWTIVAGVAIYRRMNAIRR